MSQKRHWMWNDKTALRISFRVPRKPVTLEKFPDCNRNTRKRRQTPRWTTPDTEEAGPPILIS